MGLRQSSFFLVCDGAADHKLNKFFINFDYSNYLILLNLYNNEKDKLSLLQRCIEVADAIISANLVQNRYTFWHFKLHHRCNLIYFYIFQNLFIEKAKEQQQKTTLDEQMCQAIDIIIEISEAFVTLWQWSIIYVFVSESKENSVKSNDEWQMANGDGFRWKFRYFRVAKCVFMQW